MTEREQDPYIDWIVREARRPVRMGPEAKARLLDLVRSEPVPARPARPWRRLVQRRNFSLSPLLTLATAAGLVGIGVVAGLFANDRDGRSSAGSPSVAVAPQLPVHDTVRVVKFVLVAPQARVVSLVGDFNQWDAQATPMTKTPTGGTWSVTLQLQPGRHLYAFVVDGTQWLADPKAPLAPEDGFGAPNSVVLVGGPST